MNQQPMPKIEKDAKGRKIWMVDDQEYFALAGEIHNSSSSTLAYMEEAVWPSVEGLGLDALLVPVAWESVEPAEGAFDFALVDGLLDQARARGVRLVLLWFGLWKNGESYYAPGWVKRDGARFFRACYAGGQLSQTISPLCETAVAADARAFANLMAHLREADSQRTVIMMQVENEMGMLGAERDFSEVANAAYSAAMPKDVLALIPRAEAGMNWAEALGEDAPEWFMAYHYARATERIAAAGKVEYGLPMYVNAWLEQFPRRPGVYPSGGPIAKMMGLWQACAPSIDALAPDIYLADFAGICEEYMQDGNPLLIPEARRDPVTASNAFYAAALGMMFSPFGIDSFFAGREVLDAQTAAQLNIDMSGVQCAGTYEYLRRSYEVLRGIKPLLLQARGEGKVHPFIRQGEAGDRGTILAMDGLDLQIEFAPIRLGMPGSAGFVIDRSAGEFFAAGCNFRISALPKRGSGAHVSMVRMEEGAFVDGLWVVRRVINGDEGQGFAKVDDMAEAIRLEVCVV